MNRLLLGALWLALAATHLAAQNLFNDPDFGKKHIGFFDGSYAQCILKEMPGVANDATAQQIATVCLRRYPEGLNTDEGGGSLFGYESGPECAAKKGKDTPSRTGGSIITWVCNKLYEPKREAVSWVPPPPFVPDPVATTPVMPVAMPDPPKAAASPPPIPWRRPDPPANPCVIKPVMSDEDLKKCREPVR